MQWTGEKIRRLRALAVEGKSQREAAEVLGVSKAALEKAAVRHRVRFPQSHLSPLRDDAADIRARWAEILPILKENLRRDLNI